MLYYIGQIYKKSIIVSDDLVNKFAEVSGDKNPIHLDDEFASKTQFKKRIVHGMLLGSFISAILGNEFPGQGTIYLNQNLSFRKPIYINDTVDIIIEVIEIKNKKLTLKTNCYVNNNIVIEGEGKVLIN